MQVSRACEASTEMQARRFNKATPSNKKKEAMNSERATALYKGRAAFLHYSLTASGDGLDFALHRESLIELQGSRCRSARSHDSPRRQGGAADSRNFRFAAPLSYQHGVNPNSYNWYVRSTIIKTN